MIVLQWRKMKEIRKYNNETFNWLLLSAPVIYTKTTSDKIDQLTQLLSSFIQTFTNSNKEIQRKPSAIHDLYLSEDEILNNHLGDDDPLHCLDIITPALSGSTAAIDQQDDDFQKALLDLARSFYDEEKGDPLSAYLANILNHSLRCRPRDKYVKTTASKIKFPSNVENMKVH